MLSYNRLLVAGLAVLVCMGMLGTAAAQDDFDTEDWELFGGLFAGALCFFWIIMFVIWIAIGVWMYKDAEKRGKSGALWLIIGLLFGIIGLIVWLIVRPPEPSFYESKAQEREEKPRRSCPECGREIPLDANTCPYCGKKFGSA
ncbi:MAG: zinc ribbon domain-containing protein [Candidatus Thermoplasmatota archaeon]|nr:zinc ribbon domain-containing protein [Candidatus Thermoplasmatota archaeon]